MKFPSRRIAAALCLCLLLTLPILARAQSQVQVTGTVMDPSGAAIAGAQITLRDNETGDVLIAVSGDNGSFSLTVPLAVYAVSISAPHFAKYTMNGFSPAAGSASALNVTLRFPTAARPPQPPDMPQPKPTVHTDSVEIDEVPASGQREPGSSGSFGVPASAHSVSGHAFLVGGEFEQPGYGLYSYLLLCAVPATQQEKDRDLAVIKAFIEQLSQVSELESAGFTKHQINITYLPLKVAPPDNQVNEAWVLTHYNFERAKFLLMKFHTQATSGPYVLSSLTPALRGGPIPAHYLWQDLSHVSPGVAVAWEKEFENSAKRQDFWAPNTRDVALLHLRDSISTAASGLSEVTAAASDFKTALASWLAWK